MNFHVKQKYWVRDLFLFGIMSSARGLEFTGQDVLSKDL